MVLNHKSALITGASRGIGLALAHEFAKKSMHLHLVARSFSVDPTEKLKLAGALSVTLHEVDLSDMNALTALVAKLDAAAGADVSGSKASDNIDVLVNNAGLLTGGLIENQNPDEIDKMFMVNLHALVRLTRLFLPKMLKRKSGYIVNNSSVSGRMFFPCASTYAASKAGVVAFTESIKQELRGTGVSTLLLMTPGVKTEMFDDTVRVYGENMDVSFLSSMPAEKWAQRIVRAIENDEDVVLPEGSTRFGLWLGHHLPQPFQLYVRGKFHR